MPFCLIQIWLNKKGNNKYQHVPIKQPKKKREGDPYQGPHSPPGRRRNQTECGHFLVSMKRSDSLNWVHVIGERGQTGAPGKTTNVKGTPFWRPPACSPGYKRGWLNLERHRIPTKTMQVKVLSVICPDWVGQRSGLIIKIK